MHTGYWFAAVLFTLGIMATTKEFTFDNNFFAAFLTRLGFDVAYFYLFYVSLVPKFLAKRRVKRFFGAAFALCLLAGPLQLLIQFLTLGPDLDVQSGDVVLVMLNWIVILIFYTFLAFFNGMMGALLKGFITWYDEIHVKEVLIRKNLETELALLKAQLNPHFLFNTLNNIDILIEKNATAASVYLKKLSDIIRFTLYDTQEERIPLEQELEYIRKFIDLQHIRTAHEFVELDISGDPKNFSIAPMVFIPFIENAFKHSTNKKIENAIVIKIKIANNAVLFSCVNVIDKERPLTSHKSGLGLDLIRQRLQLLYKNSHSLEIGTVNDMFNVSLKLNLNAA